MTTRIGRCIKTPALTPYTEDAQQFNSQLGNLLRPALDTPETIAAERRRTGEPADQHLARALASTPPAEQRVLPGGTPVQITRPSRVTAVYLYLHGGGLDHRLGAGGRPPNARIAATCGVAVVSVDYRLAPEHPYPAAGDRHTRHRPSLPGGHAAAHLPRPERRATARPGNLPPLRRPPDSDRLCSPWGLS